MSPDPWGKDQMRLIDSSVLQRSVERFRQALQYLEHSRSQYVQRLRRGLYAMEEELGRRTGTPQRNSGDGAPVLSEEKGLCLESTLTSFGGGENDRATVCEPVSPGEGKAEEASPASARVGRDSSVQGWGNEPVWRLIPHLSGTSSKVVTVLSDEGVVRYQSEPIKWVLGFEAALFTGEPLESFLCSSSREQAAEAVARMGRGEEKFDCWRLEFRTASGGSFWMEGMASNFLHDPRLGGILVYWREYVGSRQLPHAAPSRTDGGADLLK